MTQPFNRLTLYLASSNPGKLREFQEAASNERVRIARLREMGGLPPCVEDGQTFEENARKKALYYASLSPRLVLAEDSGLAVDALGGRPGVYSARFSGPGATEDLNNRKLIEELSRVAANAGQQVHPDALAGAACFPAHYVCVIALARDGDCLAVTDGRVDGVIIGSPRGSGGFGYDPYFFYPPYDKTFAEITAPEKFAVSHRGIAFRKLLSYLKQHSIVA